MSATACVSCSDKASLETPVMATTIPPWLRSRNVVAEFIQATFQTPHAPRTSAHLTFISKNQPRRLVYWASTFKANPQSIPKDEKAYDRFQNSGIVQVDPGVSSVTVQVETPSLYRTQPAARPTQTTDDAIFPRHVHFAFDDFKEQVYTLNVIGVVNTETLRSWLTADDISPVKTISAIEPPNKETLRADTLVLRVDASEDAIRAALPASTTEARQRIPIVVYCKSGCNASTKMATRLQELGYLNVFEYPAGVDEFKQFSLSAGGAAAGAGTAAGAGAAPRRGNSLADWIFKGLQRAPSSSDKKFVAHFENVRSGRSTRVSFGQRGAEDFTIHGDPERKRRYIERHKRRERWDDPVTAGALSRWLLWERATPPMSRRAQLAYCNRFQRLRCALQFRNDEQLGKPPRLQGGKSRPEKRKKGTTTASEERTNPALWEKAKSVARSKFGGHSARAMQYAVFWYKNQGGRYKTKTRSKDNALHRWTTERWRTKSGKRSRDTGERYLPSKVVSKMPAEMYARTSRAKRQGTSQYVAQPADVRKWIKDHKM